MHSDMVRTGFRCILLMHIQYIQICLENNPNIVKCWFGLGRLCWEIYRVLFLAVVYCIYNIPKTDISKSGIATKIVNKRKIYKYFVMCLSYRSIISIDKGIIIKKEQNKTSSSDGYQLVFKIKWHKLIVLKSL